MARYTFDSNGGCERCDGMDGVKEFEPRQPHTNCMCEIAPFSEHHCASWETDIIEDDFAPDGSGGWDHDITIRVTVTCCNGDEHTTDITTSWHSDSPDDEREAQLDLMDEMESAAEWMLQNNCIGLA